MSNLAYKYDDIRTELLNGKIVAMASAAPIHAQIALNIAMIFNNYLKGKRCKVLPAVDVHLGEKDVPVPDISVVCNKDIIKANGVHGAPDLIVEILSPSTAKNDKTYKKRLYQHSGVKEYWIVDPKARSIEVYLLQEDNFDSDKMYALYENEDFGRITEERKAELLIKEFKSSLFDDLIIRLDDIFEDIV